MTAKEYGQQNAQVVILLHGGGLSWWNYREAASVLAQRYHVVLPVLDGHADSDAPFTTVEENAARIIRYVDAQFGGRVLAIGGLSLGGQIALEILSQRPQICRYALIESALVKPMKLTAAMLAPSVAISYGLIRRKWFAKMQFDYLRIRGELFEDYYRDTCRIGKADMIAFMKANCLYTIKPSLSETGARVAIVAGSREQKNIRDSAKLIHRAISGSRLEILEGLYHGDLSINHPLRYARMLEDLCGEEGSDDVI